MPRKWLKSKLPKTAELADHKILRYLGPLLLAPELWHLHRRNVARAASIGLFCAFLPLPVQMLLAAILAIALRANLPVSVVLVWVSNPLTIPPMFYFSYKVGTWILGVPIRKVEFSLSLHWLLNEITVIWKPLFLGSFICAIIASTLANIIVRFAWRAWVVIHWRKRRQRLNSR